MGWGNIGLSWTRYAKSTPTRNCARCHLDYAEEEDRCPHCGSIEDHELQDYLHALEEKKEEKEQDNWSFSCLVTAVCFFRSLRSAYITSLMKEIKGGQGNLIFKLPGHL